MPFTKTWLGTTSDYGLATNWRSISVRTSAYSWTASGSGTDEYYLRTSGSANPGFAAKPDSVYINGASATEGTPGSLAAGRWGYGDNDTLGYSTLYVRLSDGADPDSKVADYVQFYQTPRATEHVAIPVSGGTSIASSLDASSVAVGDFSTAERWAGTIGSSTGYLRIDPDLFRWAGGTGYVDIGSAAISPRILATASASSGYYALNLRGSAIATLDVQDGIVAVAPNRGDTSTITTARIAGGTVLLSSGVTLTTLDLRGGLVYLNCSATTVTAEGGTVVLGEAAALTTLTLRNGAKCVYGSTGNITTVNLYDQCRFDEMACMVARTITNMNYYGGARARNYGVVTYTNYDEMRPGTVSR